MDKDLYEAITNLNIEHALRATCQCLKEERWTALQETWVRLLNEFGERIQHANLSALFYRLMKELHGLIHAKELFVKNALAMTTQLVFVYNKPYMNTVIPYRRPTLAKLRSSVIDYFPSDAQLTRSGRMKFQPFLPTEPEEAAFAERIIVGLLQLCESATPPEELRKALEYLARKKLVLTTAPHPSTAPHPMPQETEDLIPYLFMIFKRIKPLTYDAMIETMYYYDYKSSVKPYRIGFFYMMAFLTEASATETQAIWSPVEQTFLNSVIERAHELWKEIQMEGKQKPEEDSSHLLFIPTKEESDHEEEIRVLPQPPPKASQKATKKVVLGKTEEIRGLIPMKPSSSKQANHAKLAKHEKQANQAKYDKHIKNPTSSSFKSIKDPTQSHANSSGSSSSQKVIELRTTRKEAFGGRGKTEETTHPVVLESTEWDGDDEEDVWGVQKNTDDDFLAPAPAKMQMPPQQKQRESKESLSITNLDDSWLIDGFPCRVDSGHRRVHSGKARPGIQDRSWEKNHR